MSDPANPLIAKLEAMADRIDPSVDGIAVLIVGDIQIELGCTTTGDLQFDAMRLATALEQAVRMGSVKPREVDAAAVIAGLPNLTKSHFLRLGQIADCPVRCDDTRLCS